MRSFTFRLLALCALLSGASLVIAQSFVETEPAFAYSSIRPSARTTVFGVATTPEADLVLLEGGHDQGFRVGAVAEVYNGPERIAELILIDARADRAAALIIALTANQTIQSGDTVRLGTSSSR